MIPELDQLQLIHCLKVIRQYALELGFEEAAHYFSDEIELFEEMHQEEFGLEDEIGEVQGTA